MINYRLPKTIDIAGTDYQIRWAVPAALDIIDALENPDLEPRDKARILLGILYVDKIPREHEEEALRKGMWYLGGGKGEATDNKGKKKTPRITSWTHDIDMIIPAINNVLGYDLRTDPDNLHWWTLLAAYQEISKESVYSQVIALRDKMARGKKLEQWEKDYVNRNADMVILMEQKTQQDREELAKWGIKTK